MFYTLDVRLHFRYKAKAQELLEIIDPFVVEASIALPGALNSDAGHVSLIRCYHDQDPVKPCVRIACHVPTTPMVKTITR